MLQKDACDDRVIRHIVKKITMERPWLKIIYRYLVFRSIHEEIFISVYSGKITNFLTAEAWVM